MRARPASADQQQEVARLQQHVLALTESLGTTSQSLAEALKRPATTGRLRR
jgi:phospholipid/cholesterol/gamma-HCH transport system substrate-binding protein